jgi:ribonuclease P protein subunit POP4
LPISSQNILAHEWIGLEITVTESPDPNLEGLTGLVRDETRNTLIIETPRRTLRIAKTETIFTAKMPTGETSTVQGNMLRYRPEDRVKKGLTRW